MKYVFLFVAMFAAGMAKAQNTDTVLVMHLRGLEVVDSRVFSDSMRYRFNQLKHNVEVVLPYLAKAIELYDHSSSLDDSRAKRKYMNRQEEALRDEFKEKLKNLTVTQGKILVRLIGRQTGRPLFELLKEYEGGFTAVKWQTWARLNGYDLKEAYNPQADPNLEIIMRDLGYPLPVFYEERMTAKSEIE